MFQLIQSFHHLRQSLEATYVHPADEGYIGADENWEYVNNAMLPPGLKPPLSLARGRRSFLRALPTFTGLATGLAYSHPPASHLAAGPALKPGP
eukprot:748743-Hanusia_phi.AAC.7